MQSTIRCCKDCEKRELGCHSTCEEYIQQKADRDKLREKIVEERSFDSAMKERAIKAQAKAKRKREK